MPIIKTLKQHKIVLDTHVLLWLMDGNSILSTAFRKAVSFCQKHDGILISPITIWEIGMLVDKQRVQLEMDCLDWVDQALESPGIVLMPITPRIAIQSTRLPGAIHGDPADRILVATAHECNAVLITCDEKLLAYGKDKFLNVHDPR
ncbi:MAG: type II toxin-antitoxin system VapC family toxin [Rhabdochlamydiaceae bacterium]